MEPVKRPRKLEYLHSSQDFRIPKSTFYERRKRQAAETENAEPRNGASCSVSSDAGTSAESEASRSPPVQNATCDDGTEDGRLFDCTTEQDCTMDEDQPWGDFWLDDANDEPLWDAPTQSVDCGSGDVPNELFEDLSEDEILVSSFAQLSAEQLPNLGTSKAGAVAMAMSFVVAHGLTWSALGDLATLINKIVGMEVLPRSKYMFRKLWSTKNSDLVKHWYVCETCEGVLNVEGDAGICDVCETTESLATLRSRQSFFVTLNLERQLCTLIEKTKESLAEGLAQRGQPRDTVSDITNAASFKELAEEVELGKDDLTLNINTDGSPVFKSSRMSVWPLQFIINELPPSVRFQHPMLAGLWFGKRAPNMQTFLSRFVAQVNATPPISWNDGASKHRSKVFVLCCAVDAPARAKVLNMAQFNGFNGCPWCLTDTAKKDGKHCAHFSTKTIALRIVIHTTELFNYLCNSTMNCNSHY